MAYSFSELMRVCLAVLSLPVFFAAPGYVCCSLTNLLEFRRMTWPERGLWSLALSCPIALLIAVHPGLPVSQLVTPVVFLAIVLCALVMLVLDVRSSTSRNFTWDRTAWWCVGWLVLLVAFCMLAPIGIELGHRLYENSVWQDWCIRIQLVNASFRGGATPSNPMFAYQGVASPLHYYFYWYVLCAQIAQLTGCGAVAALTASCAGAAVMLTSGLVLAVKHLRISEKPLRNLAAAALLAASVIGLDVLTLLLDLLRGWMRPDPQHAILEHAPGLINMCLWSPHHVAGLASCITGLLLVMNALNASWKQRAVHAALAGICFAAAAGTSTPLTGVFAVICICVLVSEMLRREWATVGTLTVAGFVALLLTAPFLRQMLKPSTATVAVASLTAVKSTHNTPIHFAIRYSDEGHLLVNKILFAPKHIKPPAKSSVGQLLLRLPIMLALGIVDFGFALFVIGDRVRQDWLNKQRMSRAQLLLWITFLAAAIPGMVLTTSAGAHRENDLAFHTGLLMRTVVVLWAAPLLLEFWERRRERKTLPGWPRWLQAVGVCFFALGLVGQVAQITVGRFMTMWVDAGWVKPLVVAERVPQFGRRFNDIRLAMDAATRLTPANGIVQGYPHGRFAPVEQLYATRQMAASDDGCNVPFGGNAEQCFQMTTGLDELFGGTPHFHGSSTLLPTILKDSAKMTAEKFAWECESQKLSAIVADYSSPAWQTPGTWVWTMKPVYANGTARVFLCPNPTTGPGARPL